MGDLPSAAPMHAIADGYRAFEVGDVDDGLAALTAGTDALLTAFDFDPAGPRGDRRARPQRPRARARSTADARRRRCGPMRRLDALSPEPFSDVAARLGLRARPGRRGDGRPRGATAGAATDRGPRAGRVRPGRDRHGRGRPRVHRHGEASRHLQAAAALFERAPRYVLAAELWCEAALAGAPGAGAGAVAVRRARAAPGRRARRRHLRRAARADVLAQLTTREREVVALAADGPHEPRDRRAPLPLGGHGAQLPLDGVRQARRVAPGRARPARRELKARRSSLPAGDRGTRSTTTTSRGRFQGASRSASQACRSAGLAGGSATYATGTWPSSSSARPTTAASATAGCATSSRSTSAGATL